MNTQLTDVMNEHQITVQEKVTLQLMVDGNSAQEISAFMNISLQTVQLHQSMLFRKFNADNIVKLVRLALEHELVN